MREIGGYIELDTYHLPMLHEKAVALNCGRNALDYLLRARNIKKLWIPKLICDSVIQVCNRSRVPYILYNVGFDFHPIGEIRLGDGEWLYLVNYYSQFDNAQIAEYVEKYSKVIVDNAQSYFQSPLPHVDTIYTCRKYFGVPDGAFLYTDVTLNEDLPLDESFSRMNFLLGRFERGANEFYDEYRENNRQFTFQSIKKMSKLTENFLHGIDYQSAESTRKSNFRYLQERFDDVNSLKLKTGTFMYPFMTQNGAELRKKLQKKKIYIPVLWPSVFELSEVNSLAYRMAEEILPLPIDQRYVMDDMKYMSETIEEFIKNDI